jgi:hypothetical protein
VTSTDLDALGIPWCYRADSARRAATEEPFIINLDDRGGKGTHWTAACVKADHPPGTMTRRYTLYYADPLGTLLNGYPPAELEVYKRRIVSRPTFQRPETQLCGYYAICFVDAMREMPAGLDQKAFEDRLAYALSY